jgi:phosphonate transport system substrate-binding protein
MDVAPQRTRNSFRFGLPSSLGLAEASRVQVPRLETHLRRMLGKLVEVQVAASYDSLAKELLSGKLDAAWAPPFVCARVEAMGVKILTRGVRRGTSSYRAALLSRASSPLELRQLTGLTALWVDQDSVAGYLLPLAFLKSRGVDPQRAFFAQQFAGSYRAALEGVLEGKADVTSVFAPTPAPGQEDAPGIGQVLPGREKDFSVITYTDEAPNDGVAVAMSTPEPLASALQSALLALSASDEGKALLKDVFNAERFEPAPRMGYRALYRVALASL